MTSDPVLLVEDLEVRYRTPRGWHRSVDRVSFELERGKTLALVGESGCGKTSIVNSLIGTLPDNGQVLGGQVFLDGQNLTRAKARVLRSVRGRVMSLIPQDPNVSLNPVRRIGGQLDEVLRLHTSLNHAARGKLALELLTKVGFEDPERIRRLYPHQLSGGMRQRVLIASAIALKPKVVLADEPTSGLDVTVQKRILDLIDEIRAEIGMSVLFVTHDLAVASDRADKVLVMSDGRVVESGRSASVLRNPSAPQTRKLVSAMPGLRAAQRTGGELAPGGSEAGEHEVLSVTGLTKVFSSGRGQAPFTAVDGVSFRVERGKTLAIVGESGSGKSTTARMLVRLTTPTSGSIVLNGTDVTGIPETEFRAHRREVQLVYQNPRASLDPLLDVAAIVEEPLRAFGMGDKGTRQRRVREALTAVGIPDTYRTRRPRELSGGQQQRVAIARAMVCDPSLLVLDEPVSSLDMSIRAQVLAVLDDLQQQFGVAYVFISHDLAVVGQVSDYVLVMERGRIVESGETSEVLDRPKAAYTQQLVAAIPGRAHDKSGSVASDVTVDGDGPETNIGRVNGVEIGKR